MVDKDEVEAVLLGAPAGAETPALAFLRHWAWLHEELDTVLHPPHSNHDAARLHHCVQRVIELSDIGPDLLILLILRHNQARYEGYGVFHSIHVAAICSLIAKRLEWRERERIALVGAALTMNLAITELQGVLALQRQPPSDAQRKQIRHHPTEAARALRKMGITDEAWLSTVEQHHEAPGGEGYPRALQMSTTLAQVLRCVDLFIVKLSARATRQGELPDVAARKLLLENPAASLTSVVVREFGIYPPGCYVRLASGEIGIVLRRTSDANTPLVAVLSTADHYVLAQPALRDTAQTDFAICESVSEGAVFARPDWPHIYAMCLAH